MPYWNEPRQKERTCVLSLTSNRQFQARMLYPDAVTSTYDVYAARWNKEGEPEFWLYAPEGWEELWPRVPLSAVTFGEGWELRRQLWHQLEQGIDERDFTVRPASYACIEVIEDPAHSVHARIYVHHDTGRFEVRYFVHHADCGHTVSTRWEICTFADNLSSARQAAAVEMIALAASE